MSNLITEKCTKCESMEVVMEACAKHRKAALDLKEIAQGQKKKITYYKDLVAKMENDIDDL
jgi:sulfatase maturation enzyme AslB (radical SAM superfamily)